MSMEAPAPYHDRVGVCIGPQALPHFRRIGGKAPPFLLRVPVALAAAHSRSCPLGDPDPYRPSPYRSQLVSFPPRCGHLRRRHERHHWHIVHAPGEEPPQVDARRVASPPRPVDDPLRVEV